MKRNLLFTFASVLTLVVGFISCTNDEFDECFPVPATTRSVTEAADSTITLEEVQARLDEIGKKYGVAVKISTDEDLSTVNEEYFARVEDFLSNGISANTDKSTNNIQQAAFMNDNCIDEVAVASSSLAQILLEDGAMYSGKFLADGTLSCLVVWAVTSSPRTYYVTAEPCIKDGTSAAEITYFSHFEGNDSNPRFSYSGVYYEYFSDEYPIPDMDKNNDGIIDKEYLCQCGDIHFYGYKTESTPEYPF